MARDPFSMFAVPAVTVEHRHDGARVLRSPVPLRPHARCVGEYLEHWALAAPDRDFLLQRREDGAWQASSYRMMLQQVRAVASWLLRRRLRRGQTVAVIADNSIEHAVVMFACMHVGVIYAALPKTYLRQIAAPGVARGMLASLTPGVVFCDEPEDLAGTGWIGEPGTDVFALRDVPLPSQMRPWTSVLGTVEQTAVSRAFAAVGPDTVAKILFTAGTTSEPKGVIVTQRMLCASQQARSHGWPFLRWAAPVALDWLPWSHAFGGNHNLLMILKHGGTMYIDDGEPSPHGIARTLHNLEDVSPTVHFDLPRTYDWLLRAFERDGRLREKFFSRLQVLLYAGAPLPESHGEALRAMAQHTTGAVLPVVTAWGATETSPLATDCHFLEESTGAIGLPVPGVEIMLAQVGDGRHELRVRGANVTPGYWRAPEMTARMFDAEGFYRSGDLASFADPEHPERGLVFGGRARKNFRLASGAWVHVDNLRAMGMEAMGAIADELVVSGSNQAQIGLLVFPNLQACARIAGLPPGTSSEQVIQSPVVQDWVRQGLDRLAQLIAQPDGTACRALLLAEPPDVTRGEMSVKGEVRHAAVLRRRRELVNRLHAPVPDQAVITLERL